jgi:hypothetical protein
MVLFLVSAAVTRSVYLAHAASQSTMPVSVCFATLYRYGATLRYDALVDYHSAQQCVTARNIPTQRAADGIHSSLMPAQGRALDPIKPMFAWYRVDERNRISEVIVLEERGDGLVIFDPERGTKSRAKRLSQHWRRVAGEREAVAAAREIVLQNLELYRVWVELAEDQLRELDRRRS